MNHESTGWIQLVHIPKRDFSSDPQKWYLLPWDWYIYLHEWLLFFGKCRQIYHSHGSCGLYSLVNSSLYNGLLLSPHNWVVYSLYYPKQPWLFFHCSTRRWGCVIHAPFPDFVKSFLLRLCGIETMPQPEKTRGHGARFFGWEAIWN